MGGTHDASSSGGGGLGVQLGIIANGRLKTSSVLLLARLESLQGNSLHGRNKLVSRYRFMIDRPLNYYAIELLHVENAIFMVYVCFLPSKETFRTFIRALF